MPIDYITFWAIIILVLALVGWWTLRRFKPRIRGYGRQLYGEQMDIDLRLTYKRFKELYPYSEITYPEYKELQMQRAFRRAVSSEKNKRMVR